MSVNSPASPKTAKKPTKTPRSKASKVSWRKKATVSAAYGAWVVAAFFIGQFVVIGILLGFKALGAPLAAINQTLLQTIITALAFGLTLAITIWIPAKLLKNHTSKAQLGLTRLPSWYDLLAAPLSFIPYLILAAIFISLASAFFPGFDAAQVQDVGFKQLQSPFEYQLAFLTLVVIAPIVEEALFRGYLYGKLRPTTGIVIASLVTSVIFGALHGQWNVGINVFALSLVLCGLRELTGSIWAGIVLHMLKNAIAYYGLFIAHSLIQ
jgi:membrane protease YdiL (CAAX protease family)